MYLPRRVLRGGRFHAIRKQSCLVEVDVVGKHRALSVWGLVADQWAAYCAKDALASRRQHAPYIERERQDDRAPPPPSTPCGLERDGLSLRI